MPWQLTTPYTGGTLDPTGTYDQVKVEHMQWRATQGLIIVELQYGTTVDGVWTQGLTPVGKPSSAMLEGQKYIDLITAAAPRTALIDPVDPTYAKVDVGGTPVWVELTYEAVKRGLYEYLATESVIDPGNVV